MKKKIAIFIGLVFMLGILGVFYVKHYHPGFYRRNFSHIDYIFKDYHIMRNTREYAQKASAERELKGYYFDKSIKKNADEFIKIPTTYGDSQGTHPDILYFDKGFNGYRYYMAFTPYPNSDDRFENPHIIVSNDGRNFIEPKGIKNPLDSVKGKGHFSDTDLMYRDGKLVLHYVYNIKGVLGPAKFYRITSMDGTSWSKPEIIYQSKETIEGYSPAFITEDSLIKMWFIAGEGKFVYTKSSDNEKTWSNVIKCNINMEKWKPWHVDIIRTNKGYEGLMCAREPHLNIRGVFYIRSNDGVNWSTSQNPIIFPKENSWDSGEIYRSTMIKSNGVYKIWYSARNKGKKWHIGYMEVNEKIIDDLKMK